MTSIQLSAINIIITLLFRVESNGTLRRLAGLLIAMQKDLENNQTHHSQKLSNCLLFDSLLNPVSLFRSLHSKLSLSERK